MRRDDLCDPGLCPDAPDSGRCDHCPLDKLAAAQSSDKGIVLRRALNLMGALKLGVDLTLDDIRADVLRAVLRSVCLALCSVCLALSLIWTALSLSFSFQGSRF